MEDNLLVQQLQAGNKTAFDGIYQKYGNMALRIAFMVSGNMADSEDIVQEAFVKCYTHIKELKNPDVFKSWFLQILYRTAYHKQKNKNQLQFMEDLSVVAPQETSPDIAETVLQGEEVRRVAMALGKLSMKHRTTIILHYYNQLSVQEIAAVMGCSEGTVKSRLFSARNKLKNILLQDSEEKGESCYE